MNVGLSAYGCTMLAIVQRSVAPDIDAGGMDPEALMDALYEASLTLLRYHRRTIALPQEQLNFALMGARCSRKLPYQDFRVYFSDRLILGWEELLCCPEVAGCSIRKYNEDDPTGGPIEYTVMRSVSYSPYVPRFVMELNHRSVPRPAIVGRLEKLDTIFRAKTGESRAQQEVLVCPPLETGGERLAVDEQPKERCDVLCRESDMLVQHVAIVTQAKIPFEHPTEYEWTLKPEDEMWVQTISTDHRDLSIQMKERGMQHSYLNIHAIKLKYAGDLIATAKEQNFTNTEEDLRSYLGVQMDLMKLQAQMGRGANDDL
eukprot:Skav226935  [mRNA]  locus=scaffold965:123458:148409:- [translate_table: standard]